jgi:hypothetical protein
MNGQTSSGMQMHISSVEKVYESGFIDARSLHGRTFEYVNTVFFGTEETFQEGDQCLIITDGSQKLALGRVRNLKKDKKGKLTVKNTKNDLADLQGAKSIESSDEFGNQGKVVVLPSGVIMDSGTGAVIHLDGEDSRKTELLERSETISIPHHSDIDFNEDDCNSKYKWRSEPDYDSYERDLKRLTDDSKDSGSTLTVEISNEDEFVDIKTRKDGEENSSIKIDKDGAITVSSGSTINIDADGNMSIESGGNIEVSTSGGNIDIDNGGGSSVNIAGTAGVSIGANGQTLDSLIGAFVDALATCTVTTPLGTYPVLNAPAAAIVKPLSSLMKGSAG